MIFQTLLDCFDTLLFGMPELFVVHSHVCKFVIPTILFAESSCSRGRGDQGFSELAVRLEACFQSSTSG